MHVQGIDLALSPADEERLENQKARLAELREDADLRARLLDWDVRQRPPALPITLLPGVGDDPVPVVTGRLVVANPGAERREELDELLGEGFSLSSTHVNGDILEFAGDADADALLATISEGREQEFAIGPNHIMPMNWRMKAKDGPEPTDVVLPTRVSEDMPRPLIVAVDTGIASLKDRARFDGWLDDIVGDYDPLDVAPEYGFLDLGAGHGTFVAGLLRFVSPNAQVRVLRAFSTNGLATETHVASKINEAAAFVQGHGGRGVINLSLGETTFDNKLQVALTPVLQALEQASGVAVVASAGNSGTETKHWPAAADSVIAVAGLDRELKAAPWSTRGEWVDFSTVAEGLVSTFVVGEEQQGSDDPADPFDPDPDAWCAANPNALWVGTSFAAPQVAAWLARHLAENPTDTAGDAKRALEREAKKGNKKKRAKFGWAVEIL